MVLVLFHWHHVHVILLQLAHTGRLENRAMYWIRSQRRINYIHSKYAMTDQEKKRPKPFGVENVTLISNTLPPAGRPNEKAH